MPSIDHEPGGVRKDSLKRPDSASRFFSGRPRVAAVLCWLGPDLTALVVFTLLWFGIMLAYGAKLHLVEGSILLPTAIVTALIGIAIGNVIRTIKSSVLAPSILAASNTSSGSP